MIHFQFTGSLWTWTQSRFRNLALASASARPPFLSVPNLLSIAVLFYYTGFDGEYHKRMVLCRVIRSLLWQRRR